jgi:heme exporter protein D
MGKYVVKVWLADDAALASFAELVGQKVTPQTKYIWHPQQERLDLTPYRNR